MNTLSWKSKTQGQFLLSINSKLFRQLKECSMSRFRFTGRFSSIKDVKKPRAITSTSVSLGRYQLSLTDCFVRLVWQYSEMGDFIKLLHGQRLLSYSTSRTGERWTPPPSHLTTSTWDQRDVLVSEVGRYTEVLSPSFLSTKNKNIKKINKKEN